MGRQFTLIEMIKECEDEAKSEAIKEGAGSFQQRHAEKVS
tara:strand:- start:265 stop:384 length:120 start_codon:yes stop_codon:yes gene_type:complete